MRYGNGDDCLDRWGRVLEVNYASGSPVLQFQYGYDPRGNRTFRRAYSSQLTAYGSEDSWLYQYDDLSRLVRASKGELNAGGTGFAAGVVPEVTTWDLDELGNWTDGCGAGVPPAECASLRTWIDTDNDGEYDSSPAAETLLAEEQHATNESNEIESRTSLEDLGTNGPAEFAYDGAGNLVFDAVHYIVYDAWNRVTEVYAAGTLEVENGLLTGAPGTLIERYAYDALGRRVVSRTGFQPVSITRHVYGGGPETLAEYDVNSNGVETLARWFVHGQSFPDPLVMVDASGSGFRPEGIPEILYYLKDALGSVTALTDETATVAERYLFTPYGETLISSPISLVMMAHDPGEPPRPAHYFDANLDADIQADDEAALLACVVAEGEQATAMCVFSHDYDGDGTVTLADVALFEGWVNAEGFGPPPGKWVKPFTPYFDADADGDVDEFDASGFQECLGTNGEGPGPWAPCLFVYDREPSGEGTMPDGYVDDLDWAAFAEAMSGPDALAPNPTQTSFFGNPFMWTGQRYDAATGMYGFWARTYLTSLGRFGQRDALGILSTANMSVSAGGTAPVITPPVTTAAEEYPQGLNLYECVASNPIKLTDPFGLDFWDDEVDNQISDLAGNRLYALGSINEGARWASIGLNTALSVAMSFLPGSGLYDAFQAVVVISSGAGGFWEAMDIATAAIPFVKAAKGAIGGMRALNKARGYQRRSLKVLQALCFAEGTLVLMADGDVRQIETIEIGDQVQCDFDPKQANGPEIGVVTRVFSNTAPIVLDLCLVDRGAYSVVTTTLDHPFYVDSLGAYIPAKDLRRGCALRTADGSTVSCVSTALRPADMTTYNIEVAGSHNYFVSAADGFGFVLVHNACVGHHTIPQQVLDVLPASTRNQLNSLKGPNSIVWSIDEADHRLLHAAVGDGYRHSGGMLSPRGGAWNARWRAEMHARGNDFRRISAQEFLEIRDQIVRDFGIDHLRPH